MAERAAAGSGAAEATPPAETPSVLGRLQLGLEDLYRVRTDLAVDAFVIDHQQRQQAGLTRAPREQLLLRQSGDDLDLALFVDPATVANLERNDPSHGLHEGNFSDFCLAVEGVSHFVYVALCAAGDRRVSALELELQAEVDKFACCVLLSRRGADLRRRLYSQVQFDANLDDDERARYRTANDQANRYAAALERRFIATDRLTQMLGDLRLFYRLDLPAKLDHIGRASG
ncbi:MAG TPA: hypothetical protein VH374_00355 [Polyangia bacterium]|jgi:hypothetical protein|nr:hypothetical protein [Polyangia bacterium]